MKKAELIKALQELPEDADVKVVFQDPGGDIQEIEDGDVLTIEEVGGYTRGFYRINVTR